MKCSKTNRQTGGGEADERIRQALVRQADAVGGSPQDSRRMIQSVHRKIEEERKMKKWSAKKIAVVAAAVCVFGTITAVAAGKIVGISSYSSWNDAVYQYGQIGDLEKTAGFEAKTVENFTNGYTFTAALPSSTESKDGDGNVVESGTDLMLHYEKDGMSEVFISASALGVSGDSLKGTQSLEHNGVTLYYSCDHYRFVPPSYEASDEEKALVEAGELFIGYGSDKVEDKENKSVLWKDGGVTYTLSSFDNTMTADEFLQMAAEIVDAE